MTLPKVVVWNCRGAGTQVAFRHLLLLVRRYNPDILILEETRLASNYIDKIIAKTRLNASIVSEAHGFSRDIWILWDKNNLELDLVSLDDQIINMVVCSTYQ